MKFIGSIKSKVVPCLVLMTVVVFAASCSGKGEEVDLRFGWWGNPVRNERTAAVIELFQSEHDNVFVEEWTVGWGDYWGGLATMAAGGGLPDVVQMDWGVLDQYVASNFLVDLSPMIADRRINLVNVPQSVVELGAVGDGIYAISIGMAALGMVYNKTLLDSLGITAGNNMSIQDFVDISREVYSRSGVRANMAFGDDAVNFMEILLRQHGIVMMTPEGLGGTPDHYLQFFEILRLGLDEGWHISLEETAGRQGLSQDPLVFGAQPNLRSWMAFFSSNQLIGLQSAVEDGVLLGIVTVPSDNPARSNFFRSAMYLSITSHAGNHNAAASFINFWINSVPANKILLTERGMPISTEVVSAIYGNFSREDQVAAEYLDFVTAPGNSSPVNPARPSGGGEISAQMNYLAQGVALGRYTPREAAQNIFDFGNRILRQ